MKPGVKSVLQQNKATCRVLQSRFDDVDGLAEPVQLFGNIQFTQLSRDRLQCDLWAAVFDEIQFVFSETTCPLLCVGDKNKNFVSFNCILDAERPGMISHDRRVSEHALWGFAPDWETRMVVPAKLQLATLQIKRNVFRTYLQVMERPDIDLDERFWDSNYVVAADTLPAVRAYLTQLSTLILHQPAVLRQPHFKTLVLEDFIPLLINTIPPAHKSLLPPPPSVKQAQLVKQAEDYMQAHIHEPLTLKELCTAIYSSRTTLFSAFQEVFGVGPMEYLKVQRLHSVRRQLKAADPRVYTVTAIAQRYGFWSAGHFTRDYKQMFGELPSATLKQASPG